MMRILLLDRGNQNLKAAVFESDRIMETASDPSPDNTALITEMIERFKPSGAAVSSVIGPWTAPALRLLETIGEKAVLVAGPDALLPFELLVDEPRRLGPDRISAACGVVARGFREGVIIDAGTAITVDLLTEDGFAGGSIIPGFALSFDSLSHGTAALPRVDFSEPAGLPPGPSTEEAIRRGVFWGTAAAVERLAGLTMEAARDDVPVFLTGGASRLLSQHLRIRHTYARDLVLEGLAYLFSTNMGPA